MQAHLCEGAVTGSRGRGLWVIAVEKATGQPLQWPPLCASKARSDYCLGVLWPPGPPNDKAADFGKSFAQFSPKALRQWLAKLLHDLFKQYLLNLNKGDKY
jgi:hypothetical protein